MMMKTVGAMAALALAAGSASASVTFIGYGTALPTGESLITDFGTSAGLTGSALLYTGSKTAFSAAPAFSATTVDTAQYLSVRPGDSETIVLPSSTEISLYVGSLDPSNTFAFGGAGAVTYTASQLAVPPAVANGNWTSSNTNGRFIFTFSAPVTSLTLSSPGNTLEVASIAGVVPGATVGGVPESATWALMLIGIGGLGGALRQRRSPRAFTA